MAPALDAARPADLDRPGRERAVGGDTFGLSTADQPLMTVSWLWQYPTNEVLGFLFGVSDLTASRARTGTTNGSLRPSAVILPRCSDWRS